MAYYVYILKCSDDSYYTGYTSDLSRRVKQHNEGIGGRYTRSRKPVKLLYQEEYATRAEAMRREREIKKMSRMQKTALIT